MDYYVDRDALYSLIDEEVSYAADEAYDENGSSLYDAIVLTKKDKRLVSKYIDDALSAIVKRMWDICKYKVTTSNNVVNTYLVFNLPDIPTENETLFRAEIGRVISLYAITEIYKSRRPALLAEYQARTAESLEKANLIARMRESALNTE